ncbi:Pantoate--beta-alanine ligase [hydrothermal vent metagenome]|uniref:pantoate--beta-alanine ligase (AMP-forming) n=1 Tax=hydrothermal vent metagenome TaxID=652676 RepID=A0A1W1B9H4_9ZZZZ
MQIIKSIDELKLTIDKLENSKRDIGFVPTMGALHSGHLSLIRRAREESATLIVSIFVNPTQFLDGEDLESYPSKEESDRKICEVAGVDILFMPSADDMYSRDELSISAPSIRGYILEGAKRAGHFDGVLQIVMKLLNLTRADRAYFGKKDAQQLALVTQMAQNYFLDCEIVACEIVRDEYGLALSSRNAYLSDEEKNRAYQISKSLKRATQLVLSGVLESQDIISEMTNVMSDIDIIEYISIVDRSFNQLDKLEIGNSMILVAVRVGGTRLIDNIWI